MGISFPCWSLLRIVLPEPKGERSYFSICSRIQVLQPCISSNISMEINQSLHTLQEAKVTVDEIEAPEEAEADAMCLDINCCSGMQVCRWHVINISSYMINLKLCWGSDMHQYGCIDDDSSPAFHHPTNFYSLIPTEGS